jgi:hypothetical protein
MSVSASGGGALFAACWLSNAFAPKITETAAMATRLDKALRKYLERSDGELIIE